MPQRPDAPTIVNVNSHRVRGNRGAVACKPPIVVRTGRNGRPTSCYRVEIVDEAGVVVAEVVYQPRAPLKCGAEVFITCAYGPRLQLFPDENHAAPEASVAQSTRGRRARSSGRTP